MKRKVSNKSMKAIEEKKDSDKSILTINPLQRYFHLSSEKKTNISKVEEEKKAFKIDDEISIIKPIIHEKFRAEESKSDKERPMEEKLDLYKIFTLSSSQMDVLKAISNGKSVFFTGAAGSGKSFILKILQDLFYLTYQREKIAFTAPTGVAACNIGGRTINSWAGIGLCDKQLDQVIKR